MKGIKQAFQSVASKVTNQPKGCVQCDNDDCSKCKRHQSTDGESPVPPTPGCCDLQVSPFFGGFTEPISSTEFVSEPFDILTTDGVSACQVTLEFNSQCFDGASDTYLNINGIDYLLPNNIPTQYTFNNGDVIFLKTLHLDFDCSSTFTSMNNVSCLIDYGVVYAVNFGDPLCDFCPQWEFIEIQGNSTTIFTLAKYPTPPFAVFPGWTYKNTTSQTIQLFINPTIINGSGDLFLLQNGIQVHQLVNGNVLNPIVWNLNVGEIIGFQQNTSITFSTETFITNETCDIIIGSQIMKNL